MIAARKRAGKRSLQPTLVSKERPTGLREYVGVTTVEEEFELWHFPENILASGGFELSKYWTFSDVTTFEPIR
jgi:hypothetical protein